jgi:hypothetical protein
MIHSTSSITRCQPDTVVSYATLDGGTSGTASVPTTGSQAEEALALKTFLRVTYGWIIGDTVVSLYAPHTYAVLFDTVSARFIRNCSVTGGVAMLPEESQCYRRSRNVTGGVAMLPEESQ